MSTVTQETSAKTSSTAIIVFRLVLIITAAGCLAWFWYTNGRTDDYRLRFRAFEPWLWNLYLTFGLASVAALLGMWNWHKWGVWLLAAMAVSMLFTECYAMGFSLPVLRIPAAFAAVWFAAQPVWKRLV